MSDSLFSYSRPGFAFEIFENRIEVKEGTFAKKSSVILLRSITSVESGGALSASKLKVTTVDGKKRDFNLGTKAKDAAAILNEHL